VLDDEQVGRAADRIGIVDAEAARGVYESIVRRQRDPGLLEYYGRGCLRASVFPIPPQGEMEVEATYRELLPIAGDLFRWSFPVAAAGVDGCSSSACEMVTLNSSESKGLVIR